MDHTPLTLSYDQQQQTSLAASSGNDPPSSSSPDDDSPGRALLAALRRRYVAVLLVLLAVIVVAVVTPLAYREYQRRYSPPPFSPYTTCDIFCTGPILAAFQLSGMFRDSKSFVDFSLRASPSEVYADWVALNNASQAALQGFLDSHFYTNTSDLLDWDIPDWRAAPPLLAAIADPVFANFSSALNGLWLHLGRRVHPDVYEHPDRHTLLPLKQPYMVVPGGRFHEFYYWSLHPHTHPAPADPSAHCVLRLARVND